VPGLTVTTKIPGATVGAISNVTATSFQVSITVPSGTTAGVYSITVTIPDHGVGTKKCLTVT
jgi:uncharacterized membrane protein